MVTTTTAWTAATVVCLERRCSTTASTAPLKNRRFVRTTVTTRGIMSHTYLATQRSVPNNRHNRLRSKQRNVGTRVISRPHPPIPHRRRIPMVKEVYRKGLFGRTPLLNTDHTATSLIGQTLHRPGFGRKAMIYHSYATPPALLITPGFKPVPCSGRLGEVPPSVEARGRVPRSTGHLFLSTKAVQEHDAGHSPCVVPAVREIFPRGGLRVRLPQGEPVPVQPGQRCR